MIFAAIIHATVTGNRMRSIPTWIVLAIFAFVPATAAPAADLCGRPGGKPLEVFERLTKVEKLPELSRDSSYVALRDAPNMITWTFTVPGHAAYPAVVCRRIVQDSGGRLSLGTQISCDAPEAACLALKRDFDALNARMMEELKKQQKR